jgi:hypothetical protein
LSFKINLHAHSTFSDGHNHPLTMARTAKVLGFSALVLSDHYYNGKYPECAMVPEKEEDYCKALEEAREVLPVIRAMEVPFSGEEVLVFGEGAIREIIDNKGIKDNEHLKGIRERHNCAVVLCHPSGAEVEFTEHLDGFERHNCGEDQFSFGGSLDTERLNRLNHLQSWHNSDAHGARMLNRCYNLLDTEVTTEEELIKYIKSGASHGYEVNDYDSEEQLNVRLASGQFPPVMYERKD